MQRLTLINLSPFYSSLSFRSITMTRAPMGEMPSSCRSLRILLLRLLSLTFCISRQVKLSISGICFEYPLGHQAVTASKSSGASLMSFVACFAYNVFQSALDSLPFSLNVTHHGSSGSAPVFVCSSVVSSSARRFVDESSPGSSLNKIVLTQVGGGAREAAWCTCRHI